MWLLFFCPDLWRSKSHLHYGQFCSASPSCRSRRKACKHCQPFDSPGLENNPLQSWALREPVPRKFGISDRDTVTCDLHVMVWLWHKLCVHVMAYEGMCRGMCVCMCVRVRRLCLFYLSNYTHVGINLPFIHSTLKRVLPLLLIFDALLWRSKVPREDDVTAVDL